METTSEQTQETKENNQTSESTSSKPEKRRLGGLLIEEGLITTDQLQQALKRQSISGGQIGSILIEMEFISIENLLYFLGKQQGVAAVNLFKLNIKPEIIALLPLSKIKAQRVLPITADEHTLTLAMENVQDIITISELEFRLGKQVRPVLVPNFMMDAAMRCLTADPKAGFCGDTCRKVCEAERESICVAPQLGKLLKYLVKSEASDMMLTTGVPPSVKIANELKRLAMSPLEAVDCEGYARELIPHPQWNHFMEHKIHKSTRSYDDLGRFRVSAYIQRGTISIALRSIPDKISSFKKLGLPKWLKEYALSPDGLIVISGPAGQGKTTTLAAFVNCINRHRRSNIITFEDPVEFVHKHKRCNVNQCEVGRDIGSYAAGLAHIDHHSPDVIVLGEMGDPHSTEMALRAADTGHLVIVTVQATNATTIIERIIDQFEPHRQGSIRNLLVNTLRLSLSQRLVSLKENDGCIPSIEYLKLNRRIRGLIREGKSHQIRTEMKAYPEAFVSMEMSLAKLCEEGKIDFTEGLRCAQDKALFKELTPKREG